MAKKSNLKITPSVLDAIPDIRTSEIQSGQVRFSFKHLDFSNEKFQIEHRDGDYFRRLLERLKALSAMKAAELRGNHSKAVRSHPIEWTETSEPNGFASLNKQLRQIDAFQFQCEKNEHGRVHGFYIDNVFFVVWIDPDHKLYS